MIPIAPLAAAAVAVSYLDAKHFIAQDLKKAAGLIDVKISLAMNNRRDKNSIWYTFENQAIKRAAAECYVCEGQSLSWEQVNIGSRRIAHYLVSQGIKRGDVIALHMPNKPAYPMIWLACLQLDVTPAFINFNLTGQGLAHCIKVSACKLVIYESDLSSSIAEIERDLVGLKLVRWVDGFSSKTLRVENVAGALTLGEAQLAGMPTERFGDEWRKGVGWQDSACLIFTSGTTGLPKAANCTHGRVATAFKMWTRLNSFDSSTRIYTPMPLYHSTAALLAIGVSWNAGSTVIIGRKFSATTFWKEVRESNANVIQYVGEVLRYLLAVEPNAMDKVHSVKLAYGNGCRPDVWEKFRSRFGVATISEFFASTEGNGSLFNVNTNHLGAGAVGHEGTLASFMRKSQQTIVRVDALTEEPARGADGFCIRAEPNEDGELICVIINDSPFQAFAGYAGNAAGTEKKILRDVFVKGDMYFRTGDLLKKCPDGFLYFGDRLGDTFRWKSENVSTLQVSEALGAVVDEANVYGVLVPGHEGRAGCAAIPIASKPDFDALAIHVIKSLPKYAQPLFVRMVTKMESTGTEKQLKVALRNEGVDPTNVKDPIYWLQGNKYVPFEVKNWDSLKAGKVKL